MIILLSAVSLLVCSCQTTVHKNVWFEDDGHIVRTAPPEDSELPEASESFAAVRYGVQVYAERDFDGDLFMSVVVKDHPTAPKTEPRDLDITLRVDGEPGTWIMGVPFGRSYKPRDVEKGTAVLLRLHVSDWCGEVLNAWTETHLTGDVDAPRVEADVYLEYYIVGREYVEGQDWYYIYEYRIRFRSDHPEWEVSESHFDFVARGGTKITVPVFPTYESD